MFLDILNLGLIICGGVTIYFTYEMSKTKKIPKKINESRIKDKESFIKKQVRLSYIVAITLILQGGLFLVNKYYGLPDVLNSMASIVVLISLMTCSIKSLFNSIPKYSDTNENDL